MALLQLADGEHEKAQPPLDLGRVPLNGSVSV
jgi:hypothetical protein